MHFRSIFKFSTNGAVVPAIDYHSHLLWLGSCFSVHMADELIKRGFPHLLVNPMGTVFNPVSLQYTIERSLDQIAVKETDLFECQSVFRHWLYPSLNAHTTRKASAEALNSCHMHLGQFIQKADVVFLTLGSAWVYEHIETQQIVASCHKMDAKCFRKRLLSTDEIHDTLQAIAQKLIAFNPTVSLVLTLSPVRHLRDGFVENQRSKAHLLTAIHALCGELQYVSYFPSYEILLDDLRDYRFYTADHLHPNAQAIAYIFEYFVQCYMTDQTKHHMQQAYNLYQAINHKPFTHQSETHQLFLQKIITQKEVLETEINEILKFEKGSCV